MGRFEVVKIFLNSRSNASLRPISTGAMCATPLTLKNLQALDATVQRLPVALITLNLRLKLTIKNCFMEVKVLIQPYSK